MLLVFFIPAGYTYSSYVRSFIFMASNSWHVFLCRLGQNILLSSRMNIVSLLQCRIHKYLEDWVRRKAGSASKDTKWENGLGCRDLASSEDEVGFITNVQQKHKWLLRPWEIIHEISGRNGDQNMSTPVLFYVRPALLNLFSQNTFYFLIYGTKRRVKLK